MHKARRRDGAPSKNREASTVTGPGEEAGRHAEARLWTLRTGSYTEDDK